MDLSRLATLLRDKASNAIDDYSQLSEAYPNAMKFGSALKKGISQLVPTQEDLNSPQKMGEWGLSAALNAPMGMMFVGPKSAGWDATKAAEADKLLNAGADPAQVWKEHLIGRMPDKSLFSEISDAGASHIPVSGVSSRISENLNHPELLGSYPYLDNISMSKGSSSYFSPEMEHIKSSDYTTQAGVDPRELRNSDRLYAIAEKMDAKGTLNDSANNRLSNLMDKNGSNPKYTNFNEDKTLFGKSVSLHELQHAIQNQEGWAMGGSPEQMKEEALAMLRRDVASGEIPSTEQAMSMLPMAQHNAYRRLTGEAQARATQDRMNMNMQQRRESYPLANDMLSDIPINKLLTKY